MRMILSFVVLALAAVNLVVAIRSLRLCRQLRSISRELREALDETIEEMKR